MRHALPVRAISLGCASLLGLVGCTGDIGGSGVEPTGADGTGQPGPGSGPTGAGRAGGSGGTTSTVPPGTMTTGPTMPATPPPAQAVLFPSAIRRLTRIELRQTLLDLTGLDLANELANLPVDFSEANDVFAFDNKYSLQQPSSSLIEAARNVAETVAGKVLTDPPLRTRIVPCTPGGPGDAACLRSFVSGFGRRALRRALSNDEVGAYVTRFQPFAVESNDFFRAVALVVRVMLQDMEFLYRVELGAPVQGSPDLLKLGGYEVASRLSYLLWGTMPDEVLLQAAETGERLQTAEAVRAAAMRMLADGKARAGVGKFHAMWLGYEQRPPPATLQKPMLAETRALLDKVIFTDRRPWLDLFRARETYVDRTLATHYGLTAPASGSAWVPYGGMAPRQGILSHGSFLGVERKHDDTSPTMRGHFVRTRMMCMHVPDPPPEVDPDSVLESATGACKADKFQMYKMDGCKGCHQFMDQIGHGLENYDRLGRYRTHAPGDEGKAACAIGGAGELTAYSDFAGGTFRGVAGLADRLVESGALESCVATQLAQFWLGREVKQAEEKTFGAVAARFKSGGHRFDQMLLDLVALPGFGYRVPE